MGDLGESGVTNNAAQAFNQKTNNRPEAVQLNCLLGSEKVLKDEGDVIRIEEYSQASSVLASRKHQ